MSIRSKYQLSENRDLTGTAWLVVVIGQSNAAGRSSSADLPDNLVGDVGGKIWVSGAWQNLNVGNSGGADWGFDLPLFKDLSLANPSIPLYMVKVAQGGTAICLGAGDDWSPNSSGELYDEAVTSLTNARANLDANGVKYINKVVIWMQGEADSKSETCASAYEANLLDLISSFRTDTGFTAPWIIGQIHTGLASAGGGIYMHVSEVRAAQSAVAASASDLRLIDTDSFNRKADGIHLDETGNQQFATQAIALF